MKKLWNRRLISTLTLVVLIILLSSAVSTGSTIPWRNFSKDLLECKVINVVDSDSVEVETPGKLQYLSSKAKQPKQVYWASAKSNKFHYPWCKWAKKIKPGNLIVFKSRQEALNAGYIPCKVCKP